MNSFLIFIIPDYLLNTPWYLFPIIGLATLLPYFVAVMALKYAILRNGWRENKIAKAVAFVIGGRFLWQDVLRNYLCFAPLALHWPGRWSEDKTITAHANAIIHYYTLRIKLRMKTQPAPFLSLRERWTLAVAIFICTHLNNIEMAIGGKRHCGALK